MRLLRKQFVLDPYTERVLRKLAGRIPGNRSAVVRAAIHHYADIEKGLEGIEENPAFIKMMEESDRAEKEGRYITHEELKRQIRKNRRNGRQA